MRYIALLLGLVIGVISYIITATDAPAPATAATQAAQTVQVGGPFTLTDQTGATVTEQTYHGKYMLIFFGFTFCPDICPTELQDALNAIEIAGEPVVSRIQPIFITIDPARDTPEKLAEYVKMFGRGLVGLTGTDAQIAAVARAYKVYYARTEEEEGEESGDDYMMDHSSFLYLMGPDGQHLKTFASGTDLDTMAAELKTLVAGH